MEENALLSLTKVKKEKFIKEIRQEKRNKLFQEKRDLYANSPDRIIPEKDQNSDDEPIRVEPDDVDALLDEYYLEFTAPKVSIGTKDSILMALKKRLDDSADKIAFVQKLIDRNFIILFIEALHENGLEDSEYIILKLLGTMAAGNSEQCNSLVEKGGIEIFLRALRSADVRNDRTVLEMCFWTLGNISGDSLKFRDILFKMNVFELTMKFLETRADSQYHFKAALRHAVWLLSNMCREKPAENYRITYKAFPVFTTVIQKIFNDISVFTDSAFAIKQLILIYLKIDDESEENRKMTRFFLECNLLETITNLLKCKDREIIIYCLTLLGRVLKTDTPEAKEIALNIPFIQNIVKLMKVEVREIRKRTLKIMNILVPWNPELINLLYSSDLHRELFNLSLKDDISVKEESYYLIANILQNSTQEQFEVMLKHENPELLEVLYWGLKNKDLPNIIIPSLDNIYFLLNFGKTHLHSSKEETNIIAEKIKQNGILKQIEDLQYVSEKKVYDRCVLLLESFFTLEDEP